MQQVAFCSHKRHILLMNDTNASIINRDKKFQVSCSHPIFALGNRSK